MNSAQSKIANLTKEAYVKFHVPVLTLLMNDVLERCIKETITFFDSLQPKAALFRDAFPVVVGGMAYNSAMHDHGLLGNALETKDIDLKFFLSSDVYKIKWVNNSAALNSKKYLKEMDIQSWLDEFDKVSNSMTRSDVVQFFNKMIERLGLPSTNTTRRQIDIDYHHAIAHVMSLRLMRHFFIKRVKADVQAYLSNMPDLDGFRVSIESWYPKKVCDVSSIESPELVSVCCAYIYSGYQFQFACLDTSFVSPNDTGTSYWYNMYFKYLEKLGAENVDKDVALNARCVPMSATKFSDSHIMYVSSIQYLLMDTMKMLKKGEHVIENPGYEYLDYLYMDTYKYTAYLRKYMDLTSAMGRKFFGHRILESNYLLKADVDALIPMFDAKLKVLERENMLRTSEVAIENARKEYTKIILELYKVFKKHAFSNGWDELQKIYESIPIHPLIPVQRPVDLLTSGDDEENVLVVDGEPIIYGKKDVASGGGVIKGGKNPSTMELDSTLGLGVVSIVDKKEFLENVKLSSDGFHYNIVAMNKALVRMLDSIHQWNPVKNVKNGRNGMKIPVNLSTIQSKNNRKIVENIDRKDVAAAAGGRPIKRGTKKL